jgi:phosphoglycerate kinase
MARFKTLDDLDVAGRRVLLRADLNVPMRDGRVTDTTRIDRLVPTIEELAGKGARIVLLSHFGRPKGKHVQDLSLAPLVAPLSQALGGRPVAFAADCVGPAAAEAVAGLGDGQVALLENLRFHAGEEANDHRAHASAEALARLLPAAAGRLMQGELEHLSDALETPVRPVVAIVGGAKISTKLDLLGNLVRRVDMLVIGGGMANTFLNAMSVAVGASLCEHDMAETARAIVEEAKTAGCDVVLPTDAVVAAELKAGAQSRTVPIEEVPGDQMILDVGPATAAHLARRLGDCRTLVWNGPLGCFELSPFDAGTNAVAQAAAELTRAGRLLSVAGGGDTVAALAHAGVADDFSYVSTAGGAFLEWLEGKTLPGVAALEAAAG